MCAENLKCYLNELCQCVILSNIIEERWKHRKYGLLEESPCRHGSWDGNPQLHVGLRVAWVVLEGIY